MAHFALVDDTNTVREVLTEATMIALAVTYPKANQQAKHF
jgi:hypothetical protein